jgi:hypothetical protein
MSAREREVVTLPVLSAWVPETRIRRLWVVCG